MPDYKPCPFCGNENEFEIYRDSDWHDFRVRCEYCSAEGPVMGTRKGAMEDWNKRSLIK